MRRKKDERVRGSAVALRENAALYGELLCEDGSYFVSNAASFALPPGLIENDKIINGEQLGQFLRRECDFRWGSLPLALGVPASDCIIRSLTLPVADLAEARNSLRWNSKEHFSYGYDEAFFDLCELNLPHEMGQLPLLGVACKREHVIPLLSSLKKFRCRVQALEPQNIACARAMAAQVKVNDALLIAFIGTTFHMICLQNGEPVFFHTVTQDELTGRGMSFFEALDLDIQAMSANVAQNIGIDDLPIFCAGSLPIRSDDVAALARAQWLPSIKVKVDGETSFDSDWYDVLGLLLRYRDADAV